MKVPQPATEVRTLLISDLHLGAKHNQSQQCLTFLRSYQPHQVYLVGDVIDGWRDSDQWHWPDTCDEIVQHLQRWMADGTEVYYVPGNHDSFLRKREALDRLPLSLRDMRLANEFVFESQRGWRFLVTHGDLFDVVETQAQWISKTASFAYDTVLSVNRLFNRVVTGGKKNPYGACASAKSIVKRIVKWISGFEAAIMRHAREHRCDGVICGHTHTPAIVYSEDMLYLNTGDWVENCTGLIEHLDGSIRLESVYGSTRLLELPQHPRQQSLTKTNRELEVRSLQVEGAKKREARLELPVV